MKKHELHQAIKTWNNNSSSTPTILWWADNSAKNWRNLPISNPKPDPHNIYAHTMFSENPLIFTCYRPEIKIQMDWHMTDKRTHGWPMWNHNTPSLLCIQVKSWKLEMGVCKTLCLQLHLYMLVPTKCLSCKGVSSKKINPFFFPKFYQVISSAPVSSPNFKAYWHILLTRKARKNGWTNKQMNGWMTQKQYTPPTFYTAATTYMSLQDGNCWSENLLQIKSKLFKFVSFFKS